MQKDPIILLHYNYNFNADAVEGGLPTLQFFI